jgi:hypothetical protein
VEGLSATRPNILMNKPAVESETISNSPLKTAGSSLFKVLVVTVPATVLPDILPNHSHLVFGVALIGGCLAQYFIPPRGRYLVPLLLLSILAIVLNLLFVK